MLLALVRDRMVNWLCRLRRRYMLLMVLVKWWASSQSIREDRLKIFHMEMVALKGQCQEASKKISARVWASGARYLVQVAFDAWRHHLPALGRLENLRSL